MKQFLNVGCGPKQSASLKGFDPVEWQEIRLDIDPDVQPDIVGSITDLNAVPTASVNAIYSSHNIEHIFAHEVPKALKEFHRVLTPDGFVVITCPDIQTVCEAVANDKLLEPLFVSAAGPIAPIDILYGHRGYIAQGKVFMAHKCGFTYSCLAAAFREAGFASMIGKRNRTSFDLWLQAYKADNSPEFLQKAALLFLN